jgi:hypothetical protein
VIGEHAVFPTVAAQVWLANAAHTLHPNMTVSKLENYKLLKGIVFDDVVSSEFFVDTETTPVADGVKVALKIFSENAKGLPQYHYAADVLMVAEKAQTRAYSFAFAESMNKAAAPYYNNGTLFHGESLQGFMGLKHLDEKGLRLACKLNEKAEQVQGSFNIEAGNVFADDLVYQALLVWVREQMGLGSLPSATASWQKFREVKIDEAFDLELIITEQKPNSISADVYLVDEQGLLIAEIRAVQVTASENLKNLFKKNKAA